MTTLIARTFITPDGTPVAFPYGLTIGTAGTINNIGIPGNPGFGVGIPPSLPSGFSPTAGTTDPASNTYGNYQYSDGSVMVYIPAFYYKYGTGINGLTVNFCDVKPFNYYATVAAANAAGYALHRAFYNGGAIRPGFFVDKYLCSKNGTIASSIKDGVVLTSATRGGLVNTPFSSIGCTNMFYGSIAVAKTRGSMFHVKTIFQNGALALLSLAHASASTSTTYNAWHDAAGVMNFPKGNNNNALGDAQDATIAYVWDGNATYAGCGKTGSANFPNKVSHNGQGSGVMDINGLVWEITPFGLTADASNFYLLNTSADVNAMTDGNTLATDVWGATGVTSANYTNIGTTNGTTFSCLTGAGISRVFGNAAQTLSEVTSGTAWAMAGAGVPLVGGVGGTNQFGNDYMYDAKPADMCPIVGGSWGHSSYAGVWALGCNNSRGTSYVSYGCRVACFL